jgi:hypothetical protein
MLKKTAAAAIVAVAAAITMPLAHAYTYDRHVVIQNDASSDIVAIYASRVGFGSWQENILRGRYLAPGYEVTANIDDGSRGRPNCFYDLKAVLRDGRYAVKWNADVCTLERWTVYD